MTEETYEVVDAVLERALSPASPLAAAHEELERRLRAADAAGDWVEHSLLSDLVDVADHTHRVGDHSNSRYRADKAGPLLDAAIGLQQTAFLAYAVGAAEDTPVEREIHDAVAVLREAARAVRIVLWRTALAELHGDPPGVFAYQAWEITSAASKFAAWAGRVTATPRPDPEE